MAVNEADETFKRLILLPGVEGDFGFGHIKSQLINKLIN
jgi:hypothetical protein